DQPRDRDAMKSAHRWRRGLPLLACLVIAACGTSPPAGNSSEAPDDVPAAAARPPSAGGYEQRLRERALTQGRQGKLAEAALSWEVLTVLRPESTDYRDRLAETRRLIDATVPERLQRGAQSLKRGELDSAAVQYLAALALQPDQPQAAEALRSIERERNKRSFLGKYSRVTLTRRAAAEAQMSTPGTTVPLDRNELEHAAMLGTQGEFDDAIALLERHLAVDKRDTAACQLLADMVFQKAEKQIGRDKTGAIAGLEKTLRLDPTHTRAAARLKQLRNGSAVAVTRVASPTQGCMAPR
ncbi:MAG TPA: hypothetical protein VGP22_06160, partial [Albitalea sp.]|nr:hypothetical protein [Albitalea sp.]